MSKLRTSGWRRAGWGVVAALALVAVGAGEAGPAAGPVQKPSGGAVATRPSDGKSEADSAVSGGSASMSGAEVQKLFEHGNEAFRQGLEKAKTDRAAADALFRDAAGAWRTIARTGIQNVKLEMNIANASLLGGDVPRAIAAYRRAQAIDPLDADVRSGLAAARRAAGTDALVSGSAGAASDEGGAAGAAKRIGVFLASSARRTEAYLPSRYLLIGVCLLYMGAFGAGIARVSGVRRISLWVPAVLLVAGALAAGPLISRELAARREHDAVVVQANMLGRSGPADLYDPVFKEPLRAGLEVRIEETRAGWAKVRLGDGRTAWVRESGLERL